MRSPDIKSAPLVSSPVNEAAIAINKNDGVADVSAQSAMVKQNQPLKNVTEKKQYDRYNNPTGVNPRVQFSFNKIPVHKINTKNIQTKLSVNTPGDEYEQEADAMADKVMRITDSPAILQHGGAKYEREKDEKQIQSKPLSNNITPAIKPGSETGIDPLLSDKINSSQGHGNSMDTRMQSFMSGRFGFDFSNVKIHADSGAAQMSRKLNAKAFTVGNDIYFNAGEYRPASESGKHLLAHELVHTMQQNKATGSLSHPATSFPGTVIRRFYQPIAVPAPSSAISIQDFIRLVEAEEARYPAAEQTQTALMITRLRKIFYGTPGWDDYLIPGAAGVSPGYSIDEQETSREELDLPGPLNPDIVRKRQTVSDATGTNPAIATQQEVRLADGTFDDIGHVFAGLDALNHPEQVDGPLTINITHNVDAVTWVGDLGSVLAEVQFKWVNEDFALTNAEVQAIVSEYASGQDMLGNIDAYVIGSEYNITNSGGMKVSDLLRQYYLGTAPAGGVNARDRRYSRFASQVGLLGWNGSTFSNESSWLDDYTDEVNDAAALYVAANTDGYLGENLSFSLGMSGNSGATVLLQAFLIQLKAYIRAEP
jgi:Domain of unknown function (DUF4157)